MATKAEQEVLARTHKEIRGLITGMAKLAEEIDPFLDDQADLGRSFKDYVNTDGEEYNEAEHKAKSKEVNYEVYRLRDELHEYEDMINELIDEQLALVKKTQDRPHNSSALDLALNEALEFLFRNYSTFKEEMSKGVANLRLRKENCGWQIKYLLKEKPWTVDWAAANLKSLFQMLQRERRDMSLAL